MIVARSLEGFHLLVVDDNEPSRQLLLTLLRAVGADADEAVNGEEAVALATRDHYDAVLMDIQMPVLDGLEATRRIRAAEAAEPGRERTLIIGVTAHAMREHKDSCLESGMDAVVTKPIDPDTVTDTVRSLILSQQDGLEPQAS